MLGDMLLLAFNPFICVLIRLSLLPFKIIISRTKIDIRSHLKGYVLVELHLYLACNDFQIVCTLSCSLERVKLFTAADSLANLIWPGDAGATKVDCSILVSELDTPSFPSLGYVISFLCNSAFWPCLALLFFCDKLVEIACLKKSDSVDGSL